MFRVWTLKASDAFDKYLKQTFNPAATFFSSHQSIQHGETFTMEEHSSAKLCRGYEAANGKSPKYTLHLKIVIHGQAVFPAVCWPETCTKPFWLWAPECVSSQATGTWTQDFSTLSCLFWRPPHVLLDTRRDPRRGLKGSWASSRWRRANYFAEGTQIHGSTLVTQLHGNKRREAATPADPTRSLTHNLYSFRVQLWFSENVGRWERSRFILRRYSRKARSSDTHRL